jgi:AraC-like DNA-binding protein/biotin operon repressor
MGIIMDDFTLPHDHGGHNSNKETLHRELMHVSQFSAVSDIFKQLSDPTRVRIFWLLSHEEECVVNLAAMLEMSSPAVSHHLRSLAQSGLIVSRRYGKEVYYKAADTVQIHLLHDIVEQVMQIACPERAVDFQASQEEIIRRVHNDLIEDLSRRVTIEELSKKYLMNSTTLKRVFKEVYGETIAAHIKKHRMEAAATMLRKSRDDIAAIAQAVGYESQSRFSSAFREVYGVLPSEYRKSHA